MSRTSVRKNNIIFKSKSPSLWNSPMNCSKQSSLWAAPCLLTAASDPQIKGTSNFICLQDSPLVCVIQKQQRQQLGTLKTLKQPGGEKILFLVHMKKIKRGAGQSQHLWTDGPWLREYRPAESSTSQVGEGTKEDKGINDWRFWKKDFWRKLDLHLWTWSQTLLSESGLWRQIDVYKIHKGRWGEGLLLTLLWWRLLINTALKAACREEMD